MRQQLQTLLFEILEIMHYPNDKEKFIKEFEEVTYLEAMTNVVEKLPQDVKTKIAACDNDPHKIKQYIPEKEYFVQLEKVTQDALADFIKTTSPQLSQTQKEKIAQLFLPR